MHSRAHVSRLSPEQVSQRGGVDASSQENLSQGSKSKTAVHLRKATFKIDEEILEELDRYHLKLQLERGKRNTPHKETMVELALKAFLLLVESEPEQLLEQLEKQQQLREN